MLSSFYALLVLWRGGGWLWECVSLREECLSILLEGSMNNIIVRVLWGWVGVYKSEGVLIEGGACIEVFGYEVYLISLIYNTFNMSEAQQLLQLINSVLQPQDANLRKQS